MFEVYIKLLGEKPHWELCTNLLAAGRGVRSAITGYHGAEPLSVAWMGGNVRKLGTKKVIARVSPNGRIWKPGKDGAEWAFTHEELAFDDFEHRGDFDALGVLADKWQDQGLAADRCELLRKVAVEKKEAVRFFYLQAGYRYDPAKELPEEGGLRNAIRLAEAEEYGEEHNFKCEWQQDETYDAREFEPPMPDIGWGCICHYKVPLLCRDDPEVEYDHVSLWSITFDGDGWPGKPYSRVIEAELAIEAIGALEKLDDELAKRLARMAAREKMLA